MTSEEFENHFLGSTLASFFGMGILPYRGAVTNEESENHFLGILSTLVSTLASFFGWGFCPIKRCCRAGVMHLRMASPHWSAHCSYSLFGIGILLCKEMPCQECDEGV